MSFTIAPFQNTANDTGFSLLEMLVALSVFAALSLMGLLVLRSYNDGQIALQHADRQMMEAQIASNILRDDLANAVIRPTRGVFGGASSYFDGGTQAVVFGAEEAPILRFVRGNHAASHFDSESASVQTLEYWFQNGALVRRSYVKPDATEETPAVTQPLLSQLQDVTIRFRIQGTWIDALQTIIGTRKSLPELVEIKLTFIEGDTLTHLFAVGVTR